MSPLKNSEKEADHADRHLLQNAYEAFNTRNIEAILATLHPDVDWPNGMEGGRLHGHVRDYWTRQWGLIDPMVEPLRFIADETGRIAVDVHQVIRDKSGNVLTDQPVQHVYLIEDGLIRDMQIRES